MVAEAGMSLTFPPSEITHQKPYADFVGREYRVVSRVIAHAWSDFPDKAELLTISLEPPANATANRFVSWRRTLKLGQRVRIVRARRYLALDGFVRYYAVFRIRASTNQSTSSRWSW
jgi:hypothetical protein